MDFAEPQPKFTHWFTKTIFILSPVLIEANATILSPLENGPPPSICLLITEDCERITFVWFNDVHSRECVSPRQHFCAVSWVLCFICTRARSVAQSTRLKLVPSALCVCAFLSECVQNWCGVVYIRAYTYTYTCLNVAHTLMSLIKQNVINTFRGAHIKDIKFSCK